MQKLIRITDRISTVRVLVLLLLLSALFPLVLFPVAGIGGERPLDLYLSYSPEQVYDYLGQLGDNGRIAYARMELSVDLLFPVVYSLALMTALVITARTILAPDSRFQYLRFSPLLIVMADWSENYCLAAMTKAYPERLDNVALIASGFTSLKWAFIALVTMMLLAAGAMLAIKTVRAGRVAGS